MVSQPKQLGQATLELLAEDWTVPVLRQVLHGPLRPSELDHRLPEAPHSVVMRRLSAMHEFGIVTHERQPGLPPRAQYAATAGARQIVSVLGAAQRWERQAPAESKRGLSAFRLVADECTREIVLVLTERPMSASDIQARLPNPVARSTLRKRLRELATSGILARADHDATTYEVTESARGLALVKIAAARWEWERAKPHKPITAYEVTGVLRLFAPIVQLPADLGGVCRMRVEATPAGADVYLAAEGRRLATLAPAPGDPPHAVCHATPNGWCDALLLRRWSGVTSTGDRALMAAMLASLSATLLT